MSDHLNVGPCTIDELPQLRNLLNDVFISERDAEGDLFDYAPLLYNEQNVENLRVVREGRTIVGHAGILPRPIRWRGQDLEAGLIGGVCAREDRRGEGIGTVAMEDAAERMAALGLDFGVLWTGSHGFYERLGWRTAGGVTVMGIQEAAGQSEPFREVMQLSDSPFGPEDCHSLHEKTLRHEVIRSQEETRILMTAPRRGTWIALEGGRLSGYATFLGEMIRELEGDAQACASLLDHAASHGARCCPFPLNDPRIDAVRDLVPVKLKRKPLGMFLIATRETLVRKIVDETERGAEDLGIGPEASDEVLMARIFGQPTREPSVEPLPLDIHIGYLDHV